MNTCTEKYLGEARVVTGDKAVVFPCSVFTQQKTEDDISTQQKNKDDISAKYCYKYISTGSAGQVATVIDSCKLDINSGRVCIEKRFNNRETIPVLDYEIHKIKFIPPFPSTQLI